MNHKAKILLGCSSFSIGFAALYIYNSYLLTTILFAVLPKQKAAAIAQFVMFPAFASWGIAMIANVTASGVCCRHFDAQHVRGRQRMKWNFFLWMLWPISTPIYWYRYIWREQKFDSGVR